MRFVPFKLLRVIFANKFDDFHSGKKRPEFFAIKHVNLRAATKLSSEFVKSRLKIILAEEDTRQLSMVELATEQFRFDAWRAKDFEWPRRAPSLRDVCAFQ